MHLRMHFNPKETLGTTAEGRAKLVKALMANSVGNSSSCGQSTAGPEDLPRRYLPPGNYSDLFRLYLAECNALGQPASSASTFFRVLRSSGWRRKIKFRGESTHAQCQICHKLKSGIRHSKSLSEHARFADLYMRHLSGIFADRQAYMEMKNRAVKQRDILTCIVDSMDKSKFRLPRFAHGRVPKALETRKRPEVELTAAILHGRGIYVWVTDADATAGSDWSLEVLSRSLNKAFVLAQRNSEAWLNHLRLWTDNTPKDCTRVGSKFWGYF